MKIIDTAEAMVNEAFRLEPDAIVVILEDNNPIATICKSDWNSNKFDHIKTKCRRRKAPDTFDMGEIPIVGTVIWINIGGTK